MGCIHIIIRVERLRFFITTEKLLGLRVGFLHFANCSGSHAGNKAYTLPIMSVGLRADRRVGVRTYNCAHSSRIFDCKVTYKYNKVQIILRKSVCRCRIFCLICKLKDYSCSIRDNYMLKTSNIPILFKHELPRISHELN